jgi:hypothetical protein
LPPAMCIQRASSPVIQGSVCGVARSSPPLASVCARASSPLSHAASARAALAGPKIQPLGSARLSASSSSGHAIHSRTCHRADRHACRCCDRCLTARTPCGSTTRGSGRARARHRRGAAARPRVQDARRGTGPGRPAADEAGLGAAARAGERRMGEWARASGSCDGHPGRGSGGQCYGFGQMVVSGPHGRATSTGVESVWDCTSGRQGPPAGRRSTEAARSICTGTVALSDRPTRAGPPARPEATQQVLMPGLLRFSKLSEGPASPTWAWRGRPSP